MSTRRSFFKSLALLGAAAAGCPGVFIPKLEPVRWKVIAAPFKPRDYASGWFIQEFKYAIKHRNGENRILLHVRDGSMDWRAPTPEESEDFIQRVPVASPNHGTWRIVIP